MKTLKEQVQKSFHGMERGCRDGKLCVGGVPNHAIDE